MEFVDILGKCDVCKEFKSVMVDSISGLTLCADCEKRRIEEIMNKRKELLMKLAQLREFKMPSTDSTP